MQYLAFDTETRLFRPGNMAPQVICLSTSEGDLIAKPDVPAFARSLFERALKGELTLVGHYVAYDTSCLMASWPELSDLIWQCYDEGRILCTKVRERLLDIYYGKGKVIKGAFSLAAICKRRFDLDLDKTTWRTNYEEWEDTPLAQWPEGAKKYAIDDAIRTLDVFRAQEEDWKEGYPDQAHQARADFALRLVGTWGIHTDRDRTVALVRKTRERMEELKQQLVEHAILRPKNKRGDLSKDMARIRGLIEQHHPEAPNVPKTPKGATSTSAEVVEECGQCEELSGLIEFNRLQKINSTYLSAMLKGISVPIHPFFDVLGAASGRTSCRAPNLQNQPRLPGLRDCFVSRPGTVFVSCDYDSQELRTLAQACMNLLKESTFATRYQEDPGYDPHTEFAAQLMGLDYDAAMQLKADKDPDLKDKRQRAKAANFGFPGGMGADKFRKYARGYGLELTFVEAKDLRDRWFEMRPEMRDYFKIIEGLSSAQSTGQQQQIWSGRIRGDISYTDAANGFFQGLAADISKLALYRVQRACYAEPESPLFGCRGVNFVHDEIILEAPEDQAHDAAMELERLMVDTMERLTPDVPCRASAALSRYWIKDAEPVRGSDGRLIPWEDKDSVEI